MAWNMRWPLFQPLSNFHVDSYICATGRSAVAPGATRAICATVSPASLKACDRRSSSSRVDRIMFCLDHLKSSARIELFERGYFS